LNIKAPVPTGTSGVEYSDEKAFEKGSEKGHGSIEAHSAVDDEGIIAPDPDLDPVALDRAFRFAAWSSVALVSDLSPHWYRF
jgi:hypothetical protein